MQSSLILLVLISSFGILAVKGQFSQFISQTLYNYYHCKNSSATINDAFFQNALSGYTTFSSAMNFYKSVFTEINTTSTLFNCAGSYYYELMYTYSPFFLDSGEFNDMVTILSDFKSSHTEISFSEFTRNFSSSWPSLDKFIYNSDFTFDLMIPLYPSSYTCAMSGYSSASAIECVTQISNYTYNETTWPAYANSAVKCVAKIITSCDQSTQRMIMFEYLAIIGASKFMEFPNGLLSYIDSLIGSGSSVKEQRDVFWIAAGNSMNVDLIGQDTFQICQFSTSGSTTVISTSGFSILAQFTAFSGGSARGISQITVSFTNGALSQVIPLNINSKVPTQFSNNQTTVLNSNGQNWLTLNVIDSYSIIINDLNTRVTVGIFGYWDNSSYMDSFYDLFVVYPHTLSVSGLVSSGCQNLDPDSPQSTSSGRRKRSIQPQSSCNSVSGSSSDSTMTSSVASNMCNYLVQQTGNTALSSSVQSASSALTNVRSIDAKTFSHAAPSTTVFVPLALLLSILNMVYVRFA